MKYRIIKKAGTSELYQIERRNDGEIWRYVPGGTEPTREAIEARLSEIIANPNYQFEDEVIKEVEI